MKRWWRRANRSRTTKAEKPAVPAWSVSIDRRSSAAATERSHGPLVRLSPSRWADRARPCRAHLCRTPPRAYETAARHWAWPSPNSTVGQSVGGFSTLQISNSVFGAIFMRAPGDETRRTAESLTAGNQWTPTPPFTVISRPPGRLSPPTSTPRRQPATGHVHSPICLRVTGSRRRRDANDKENREQGCWGLESAAPTHPDRPHSNS